MMPRYTEPEVIWEEWVEQAMRGWERKGPLNIPDDILWQKKEHFARRMVWC